MKLLLVFAVLLSNSVAAAEGGRNPKWYACSKDSDCVKAVDICSGETAVNKAFLKEHDQSVAEEERAISCAPPAPKSSMEPVPRVVCWKKTCSLDRTYIKRALTK